MLIFPRRIASVLLLSATGFGVLAGEDAPAKERVTAAACFERLKQLAGEWVAVDEAGAPAERVLVIYRVTGAGSTLMEQLFPGTDHEMITMYHLDGDDLVLTHYCAAGNQPRMKAKPGDSVDRIEFDFAGGANINPSHDAHMHSAVFEYPGGDRLRSSWDLHADGRKQDTKVFDLIRKPREE